MAAILLVVAVVILTFIAPFWLKLILIAINYYIPDVIPFVDEVLQALSAFNNIPSIKFLKFGNTIRKINNKI
jgi:uncharacterized protein YqhQ